MTLCTEFSTAKGFHKENDIDAGMSTSKALHLCLRRSEQIEQSRE